MQHWMQLYGACARWQEHRSAIRVHAPLGHLPLPLLSSGTHAGARRRRGALVGLLASVLAAGGVRAQPAPPAGAPLLDEAARARLKPRCAASSTPAALPSLAVAVARDGVVLWEAGFGHADLARGVRATPATLYSVASISKPITATAVLRLVDAGRVRLDQPLDDWLPARLDGAGGDRAQATVARTLSHTAGIPLHYRFYWTDAPERPNIPRTLARYGRVVFPPGTVYSYSNLGYGFLGELVARAGGTTYERYVRDHVFRPLGMTRSTIGTGAGFAGRAVRYDAERRPIVDYDFDHRAASAVFTSARELLRFGMFHLGTPPRTADGRALGPWAPPLAAATVARMQRVETPGDTASGYALGWFVDRDHGARRVRHTGGMPGVATVLALYPEHGLAVVVLANQSSALPSRVATEVAAAVLPPDYARQLAERRAAPPSTPPPFAAPAALVGEWQGTVRTHDGAALPLVLRVAEGEVRVRLGERPGLWTLLNEPSFRDGVLGGRFVGTIPTRDASQRPHAVVVALRLSGDTLAGWAAAQASTATNDFSLSSYAALGRAPARAAAAGAPR
jgi:CubicO group peptidase (beta-lactamase class C family)